jgi:Phospholipase_D-nuclease N-terminal/Short C-terminal domain
MVVATTFWETFFLLLIFLPLLMMWGFAFVDIFRRDDIGGFSKALWIVAVLLVPFFGTLIYLIARPAGATAEERRMASGATPGYYDTPTPAPGPPNAATQLEILAALHDRGKLTDDEFATQKSKVLGVRQPMPV